MPIRSRVAVKTLKNSVGHKGQSTKKSSMVGIANGGYAVLLQLTLTFVSNRITVKRSASQYPAATEVYTGICTGVV